MRASIRFHALFMLLLLLIVEAADQCTWKAKSDAPEVYFVNMDKSVDRRKTVEQHLNEVGLRSFRVRGLTPYEIYVPDDIERTWRTARCKLETEWSVPSTMDTIQQFYNKDLNISYSAYMATLCGRGKKKNTPKELGCTTSHLSAMHAAIHSTTAKSRYALIVEDDITIPFNIDFDALVRSAPNDFGILQLFNSNENSMRSTWDRYVKDPSYVWVRRHPIKYFDFWSTCAYLIDRDVMRPIISKVVSVTSLPSNLPLPPRARSRELMSFKVVAGISNPCVPYDCCVNGTEFQLNPPCVWAPRGYQADSFLYAMTTTYMLSVPVITNGQGGNRSTFHQDHVENFHRRSFKRQRTYINQLLLGQVAPPAFMTPACASVDVNMM